MILDRIIEINCKFPFEDSDVNLVSKWLNDTQDERYKQKWNQLKEVLTNNNRF